MRDYLAQEERPHAPGERRAAGVKDVGSAMLHDAAVGHPGRADRLAVAALETHIHVTGNVHGRLDEALGHRLNQVQPPARGFGLEARFHVRGAVLQAEPAAHALGQVRL